AGAFAVVYSLRFGYDIFFGPPSTDLPRQPEEPPLWMRIPVDLLVLVCLVVGIAPSLAIGPYLATAARPVVGGSLPEYSLAVWHGFNKPFVMSLLAISGGVAGYLWLRRHQQLGRFETPPVAWRLNGRGLFQSTLQLITRSSRAAMRIFGTRRLQPQMFAIVAVALALALLSARGEPLTWGIRARLPASPAFVLLWVIGMV